MKRTIKLTGVLAALALSAAIGGGFPLVAEELAAFPGAEGGGKYTTGGRGCEVYHVTNLKDYKTGEEAIAGSLRAGIKSNVTIVFDVSGTIEMAEPLRFGEVENITIAGQTAPGAGITLAGFETNISKAQNLIIRYLRFRPGAKNVHEGDGMDGLWGRQQKNVIIDHCSFSFSTDEGLSPYRAENMSVQWCIISESLTMSGHTKGRHGYGGIWGGVNTTFHHNLLANHTSRNPRIGGGTAEKDDNEHIALLQLSNNVIYNWGFNTCYGGGRSRTNFVNNYEKSGRGTREDVRSRIIDAGENKKPGFFYVSGNYIEGYAEESADNAKGIYVGKNNTNDTTIVDTPFEMEGTKSENLSLESAENCYKSVLANAGATLPHRDAIDARIVWEVKNNEGRYINTDAEVGGYPCLESEARAADFDTDGDGMPDKWEKKHKLNVNDASDGAMTAKSGYTNLEEYLNSLVSAKYTPVNPEAKISDVKNNTFVKSGENITLNVDIASKQKIASVALFDGATKIAEDKIGKKAKSHTFNFSLSDTGTHFISVRVTDAKDNAVQTSAVQLHCILDTKASGWSESDIGSPSVKGTSFEKGGVLSVLGSGKIGKSEGAISGSTFDNAKTDDFHFVYKKISGDFAFVAKLETVSAVDNHAFSGLMVRNSLDSSSAEAALGLSWVKSTSYKVDGKTLYRNPWSVYLCSRDTDGGEMNALTETLDGKASAEKAGISLIDSVPFKDFDTPLGCYLKLERSGKTIRAFMSTGGAEWSEVGSREIELGDDVYVGFALDANKAANEIDNVNTATFSNITLGALEKTPQEVAE